MIKFTASDDFNFDVASTSIVTSSTSLTKRASARDLLKFERTPGQTDLHIIALGAYEGTGFNRNGDAFLEDDCKKNHHLFKSAGRAVHRHHKNKPNDPKYGVIKAAAYNEPMRRIELIVGLDNDKCADILDEQEKKGYTNWSMASKQAYDVCTWCDHKAKTDKDRCDCIPAKIGELNDEGVMCGMVNPNPRWFEISYVGRPADRIGMSLKLASDQRIKPMLPSDYLKIYDGFQPPEDEFIISKKATDKRQLLHKLAEMEKHVDAVANERGSSTSKNLFLKRQARLKKSPKMEDKDIDELRKHEAPKALKGMADNGIVLGPDEFVKYLFGNRANEDVSKGMKSHLPNVFSKLDESNNADVVNNEKFDPTSLDFLPKGLKELVGRLTSGHSLFGEPSVRRVMRITIELGPKGDDTDLKPKEAPTANKADEKLAEVYATYKLAALQYMQEKGVLSEEVLWNSLIQNR